MSQKKIIITGAAGFIGSCFSRLAVSRGYQPIVLDAFTYAGHKENLEEIEDNITIVKESIGNAQRVRELLEQHQPIAIINFAAESHVDNSISGPAVFIDTNIQGTFTLLEEARRYYQSMDDDLKRAFRFIQISTDEVFGSLYDDGYFTEDSPYRPNSPYSASKAASDHLARAWFKTYQLPAIITNCTNNYGPRQHPEKLIPHMITRALAGQSLPVYGDGKNVRDWIHVEDHCRGVMLALEKGRPGETYAFGGNAEMQNIDLVTVICQHLDTLRPHEDGTPYANQIAFVPDRPGHDRRYAIDCSKAKQTLGYEPEYSFEGGLKHTIEWYLEHTAWCEAVSQKPKQKKAA